MNKIRIIPWLLTAALLLPACGGASSRVESSASIPPAQSLPQEPAQSTMAPVITTPEVTPPTVSTPDASQPDVSQADAGQVPDSSQPPEAPPAVGSKPQVTPKPKPKPAPQTPASSGEICELPIAPSNDDPSVEPEPKPAPTKADAQAYIGKSVSSLIAAIGSPKGSDYAPSCLGDGEDGELFYDGFTVYTYRVNGTETVQDVV